MALILNFYLSNTTSEPLVLKPNPEVNLPFYTVKPPAEIQPDTIGHWQLTYHDNGGSLSLIFQVGQDEVMFGSAVSPDKVGYGFTPWSSNHFPPGLSFKDDPLHPSPLPIGDSSSQQINLNLTVEPK